MTARTLKQLTDIHDDLNIRPIKEDFEGSEALLQPLAGTDLPVNELAETLARFLALNAERQRDAEAAQQRRPGSRSRRDDDDIPF